MKFIINYFTNIIDYCSYFFSKLIKKIEKKFSISLYFFFPLRIFLRTIEITKFKKIDQKFLQVSNYYLPKNFLNYKKILLISGGLGFDVNFENELIEKYKINKLICFDPLELNENVKKILNKKNITFFQRPLFSQSKFIKLFLPFEKKPNPNVSIDGVYTDDSKYIVSKSINILTVFRYSKYRDYDYHILKLDIEGVADIVIEKTLQNKIFPMVICFELERPTSIFKQINFFSRLFKLIKILNEKYNLYYHTDIKIGCRLELVAVKKNYEQT